MSRKYTKIKALLICVLVLSIVCTTTAMAKTDSNYITVSSSGYFKIHLTKATVSNYNSNNGDIKTIIISLIASKYSKLALPVTIVAALTSLAIRHAYNQGKNSDGSVDVKVYVLDIAKAKALGYLRVYVGSTPHNIYM